MTVQLDDTAFQQLLTQFPQELFTIVKTEIGKTLIVVQKKVSDEFVAAGGLQSRTGKLKRSLQTNVETSGGGVLGEIKGKLTGGGGNDQVIYALLQEKGGTVTAKTKYLGVPGGPYLNIPTSANKTAAGVMRQNAGMVFGAGGYIVRSQAGKYLVMSSQNIPMFVLVKQVVIPPRLKMVFHSESEVDNLVTAINTEMVNAIR